MRKYFRSLADVLASPIVAAVNALRRDKAARQDRVLQSTKLEDMIYQGLHKGDDELIALEQSCTEKLSTFSALSRDIYQSFYSLRVRKREEESLSAPSRRFNVPILKELMDGDSYPTIKAACEGRQIPAYEAAGEFISQVADNLDSLMEQAGGQKNALETLEHLEEKRDQSMERLQMLFGLLPLTYASPPRQSRPDMLPLSQFHSSARRKSRIFRCLIPFLLMSNSSRDTTYLGKLSWMPSYAPNSRFTVSSEASRYVTCT